MSTLRAAILLAAFPVAGLFNLARSTGLSVFVGDRVRVQAANFADKEIVRTVVAIAGNVLNVERPAWAWGAAELVEVPLTTVTRLQVSQSRKSKAGTGCNCRFPFLRCCQRDWDLGQREAVMIAPQYAGPSVALELGCRAELEVERQALSPVTLASLGVDFSTATGDCEDGPRASEYNRTFEIVLGMRSTSLADGRGGHDVPRPCPQVSMCPRRWNGGRRSS